MSKSKPPSSAHEAVIAHGSQRAAAEAMGISRATLRRRIGKLKQTRGGGKAQEAPAPGVTVELLKRENRELRDRLKRAESSALTDEAVKERIFRMVNTPAAPPPAWLTAQPRKRGKVVGVPTLMISDVHHGERVDPKQLEGLNSFDMETSRRRLRTAVDVTISLLRNEFSRIEYPGIVVALAGDMVGGSIHPELLATSDARDAKVLVDLQETLYACILRLADEFGRVFLPCVSGNHGRLTHKMWAKDRNFTNADWILYQWLRSRFIDDKRVTFFIPDGAEAYYRIFNHRYLLKHGDSYRGGDSIIGPLGPLARGDAKTRAQRSEVGLPFDTQLTGHFHRLIMLRRFISNGTLKGVDEYSMQSGYAYEEPLQALWITDSSRGITFQMAVQVERSIRRGRVDDWVSVKPDAGWSP